MAEEGKMSRAISKAGAGDRLSAAPEKATGSPAVATPELVTSVDEEPSSFRLVRGCYGQPAATIVMVHDQFGEAASQIRGLRARLLGMDNGKPPRIITVTSASREEGKTTVALNLGAAFSELGEGRVVVVDGDLVAPGLHLLANVKAETGLNEALDGGRDLDDNVYETAIPNLDILPAHPIGEEDGYEGQLGRNCAGLLDELRRFYAYVIIDTPPVLAASQACTFAKHSDGVVLLARLERTPREVVKRAVDELTHSGGTILGCLLTHRKHHVPNFIYRFFGSTPGYYYGYGRSRDKTAKSDS